MGSGAQRSMSSAGLIIGRGAFFSVGRQNTAGRRLGGYHPLDPRQRRGSVCVCVCVDVFQGCLLCVS